MFQDRIISADLAVSAVGYWNRQKIRYITYRETYLKIRVNTMEKDHNGRAFD